MAYSMEKDFSISLNDLRENDVRAVLLTQVYNAGARRRMDIHNAIEDCKKYYPSDYTLLDVFDDHRQGRSMEGMLRYDLHEHV